MEAVWREIDAFIEQALLARDEVLGSVDIKFMVKERERDASKIYVEKLSTVERHYEKALKDTQLFGDGRGAARRTFQEDELEVVKTGGQASEAVKLSVGGVAVGFEIKTTRLIRRSWFFVMNSASHPLGRIAIRRRHTECSIWDD
ncbi:hypothetical protein RvY_10036 [Ramazzottius varieornatus]|uniref:Uncharacterized protein n=1 Tax=Ramazzottius varieornatus TaxID=947166 RepID=A0A1D1VKF2_RAMVA|nr:hypothetical protein RvY_10036 [Ramazzottius varieornatus]